MCGRYGQTTNKLNEYLSKRELKDLIGIYNFEGNPYIGAGNLTYTIRYTSDGKIDPMIGKFNYRPPYARSRSWINARAEGKSGKDKLNEKDDPNYSGECRIARQSGSSSAIRHNRCIVPVDFFIEGPKTERLSIPYLIRRKDGQPFGLAGFYSVIEDVANIGIVTTPAAPLLHQVVQHHRSPFVLSEEEEGIWLDHTLTDPELIDKLFHPFDSSDFEAIRLAEKLQKGKINSVLSELLREGNY